MHHVSTTTMPTHVTVADKVVQGTRQPPSMQALSACTTSALDSLRIASQDFHEIHVLVFTQPHCRNMLSDHFHSDMDKIRSRS